ncbi:MAG: Hsp20/alpha crystallin family protein [Pseudomonadota bacterium]|nr:Hsp20/alpha crystallin family protein [Pseudomonadota bacterium]
MNVRDLVPWTRGDRERHPTTTQSESLGPVVNLHHEMNRLFEDVFRAFDSPRAGSYGTWPSMDVEETDKEYRVTAEVPGLEERDIEVLFQEGVLTLRGEKKLEKQGQDRSIRERFYGRFERRVALDREVNEEAIQAVFRNGLLTVTLPKSARATASAKRIEIQTGVKTH